MLDELKEKWNQILNTLRIDFDIADVPYKTWVAPLIPYSIEDDVITIIAEHPDTGLKYIEKKYTDP